MRIQILLIASALTACVVPTPPVIPSPTFVPTLARPTASSTSVRAVTLTPAATPDATHTPSPAPVTATPPATAQPVSDVCSVDGPAVDTVSWSLGPMTYEAELTWQTGAPIACLTLTRAVEGTPVLLAAGPIPAGWTERYGEASAPFLIHEPFAVADEPPWIVTSHLAQGAGGGGGDVLSIWRPAGGVWTEVFSYALETYTTINTATETPCEPGDSAVRQYGDVLEVQPCLDGQPAPVTRWLMTAGRALPLPIELDSVELNDARALLLSDGSVWLLTPDRARHIATAASEEPDEQWTSLPHRLQVADLDGDGVAELVVVVTTPGETCCGYLAAIYRDGPTGGYQTTPPLVRAAATAFEVVDLDGDGRAEIRTRQEAFAAALDPSAVVDGIAPLQVMRLADGQFEDVTVEYPKALADAAATWVDVVRRCTLARAGAYLAEMLLLGQGAQARADIEVCAFKPGDRANLDLALRQYKYDVP